jgi:hypothetical protein
MCIRIKQKPKKTDRTSLIDHFSEHRNLRDEVVVEVNTIDGVEFRGRVTTKEAIKTIFLDILGFQRNSFGSFIIGYRKGRIITYNLNNQFDIDSLSSIENFEFCRVSQNRSGDVITSVLGCRIRVIRKSRGASHQDLVPYKDEGFHWVEIKGVEYR